MNNKTIGPSDKEIQLIVSNDQEWRRFMLEEIKEVKRSQHDLMKVVTSERLELNALKVKVGFIAGIAGAVAGWLGHFATKKLGG